MRAAIYIRVSTDRQAEEGYSIEAQKDRLTAYAQSQDWGIAKIYIDDGYSAKDLDRPRMKEMLADMEYGNFDVVLVYKLDRLTRSVSDLHELLKGFERHEVKFKSATEAFETTTAVGRLFITLVAAIAAWERETTAERVRFAKEQMIREGEWPGGPIPYGYDKQKQPIPEEFAIIREIRDLYLSGLGTVGIAKILNEAGKLRRGYRWGNNSIRFTINNPFYAGTLRMGEKLPDGSYPYSGKDHKVFCVYGKSKHEAVFTAEEFEEMQKEQKSRAVGGHSRIRIHWFVGILRCGRCGSTMVSRRHKSVRKEGTFMVSQYKCSRKQNNGGCDMPSFRQVHIEHLVMQYIEKIQADHRIVGILGEDDKEDLALKKEMEAAHQRIEEISARKSKWQYMFVEGLLDPETMRARVEEENQAEREVTQWIKDNTKEKPKQPEMKQIAQLVEMWPLLNDEEKRDFLRVIFNRIIVHTPLTKPRGKKVGFFESSIEVIFN